MLWNVDLYVITTRTNIHSNYILMFHLQLIYIRTQCVQIHAHIGCSYNISVTAKIRIPVQLIGFTG